MVDQNAAASVDESTVAEETSDERNEVCVSSATTDSLMLSSDDALTHSSDDAPSSHRTEALVATLRDARLRAEAQRLARGDCHGEGPKEARPSDDTAGPSNVANIVFDLRAARLDAAMRRTALPPSLQVLGGITADALFTVTVIDLSGHRYSFTRLHSDMQVGEFVEVVAKRLQVPPFVVRLILDGQVLDMSQERVCLGMMGIQEGSELTLVKHSVRPDVQQLAELERQWRGETQCSH